MLTDWLEALLELIFPRRCPSCRQWAGSSYGWCQACLTKIVTVRQVSLAVHKLQWLDACLTVTDYSGQVQRLIRDMKFRRITRQATKLGYLLDYGVTAERYRGIDAVVPVPLHFGRLKERGFNQTALIFKPWALRRNLAWVEALARTTPTLPQWELRLKERRKNIKGAFTVTRPKLVAGKSILLVDDIFTSGLTMDECAKALKKSGALAVTGLALASGAR
ncbi:Phosphoribosyltransferase [uncultured Sporomusa sp.]|uniref:Phosphoribosyltransferase n=1 Tax=uncultured Sporomusa sp. TaxID=307249 RepID=A0A212M1W0_9FIRM|nr:ComF family protein [uncultured Sporomusa sp.]SCM83649.1 Phosphoribosyltransferase [uncultured Sporomusa sp.]